MVKKVIRRALPQAHQDQKERTSQHHASRVLIGVSRSRLRISIKISTVKQREKKSRKLTE